jgi:leucyl-tRNA---protein transferase
MLDVGLTFINEQFHAERVSPRQMDKLLADGWRHFGTEFFRYNLGIHEFAIRRVIPLRIRLADFVFSKSQRRNLRKNSDLKTEVRPIAITPEAETLFQKHKQRFKFGIPDSIYDFLSPEPATAPCKAMEVCVTDGGRLIAASYFDIGKLSTSSIYAMFDPSESARGLGIFTILKEIEFARERGMEFLYLGYCYEGNSFYDYKKRFCATEKFDWNDLWEPVYGAALP